MSEDAEVDGYSGVGAVLGAVSLSTITNRFLEQASPIIKSVTGIDLNVIITTAMVVAVAVAGWDRVQAIFLRILEKYYSSEIRITSQDAMFAALMEYLEEHRAFGTDGRNSPSQRRKSPKAKSEDEDIFGSADDEKRLAWYASKTRNMDANIDGWNLDYPWTSDSDNDSSDDDAEPEPAETPNQQMYIKSRKRVKYAPTPSHSYYFYFKPTGHTITITRSENNTGMSYWQRQKEHITLSVYGRDLSPLKQLLQKVVDRENQKDVGKTMVFKAIPGADSGGPSWMKCFSRDIRPISTVVLDDAQKASICEDISEYLLPATSKWYANRGLPYRRGYLLYGPPGTGKTSLTVALAGIYGLRVYSLPLSALWLSDDTLAQLFSRLPRRCIVLLEDIDACGVTREGASSAEDPSLALAHISATDPAHATAAAAAATPAAAAQRVTFSGLLNAIDGVASKEGRLLIMTTNHRSRLDDALIRPGRVDMQIKFGYADRPIVRGLFCALYAVDDEDRAMLRFPKDFPDPETLEKLATEFAARVPEGVFSPAEVQGLLLKYKKQPRQAVEVVEAWVTQTRIEKEKNMTKEKRGEEERKRKEEGEKAAKMKAEEEEKLAKAKAEEAKLETKLAEISLTVGVRKDDIVLANGVAEIEVEMNGVAAA